jgi:cytochrome c-type biogenesis protein CcmE
MGIDATGQHQQPGGIVALSIVYRKVTANGLNATILDQNVALVVVYRRDNATTLNEYRSHSQPPETK